MTSWIDASDFAADCEWRDHGRFVQTYSDGRIETGILDYEDFYSDGEGGEWPAWQVVIGGVHGALEAVGGRRRSIYDFEFCRFVV
jgi:hypothetical protein